ncbi:MAG: ankyrin repeat domain-containing protein, partial [Geminicoccaceae bacterium]
MPEVNLTAAGTARQAAQLSPMPLDGGHASALADKGIHAASTTSPAMRYPADKSHAASNSLPPMLSDYNLRAAPKGGVHPLKELAIHSTLTQLPADRIFTDDVPYALRFQIWNRLTLDEFPKAAGANETLLAWSLKRDIIEEMEESARSDTILKVGQKDVKKLTGIAQKIADQGKAWWPKGWPLSKMPHMVVYLLLGQSDDPEMITLFQKKKADLNRGVMQGWTPLHVASEAGHVNVVRTLFALGAKVDKTDELGGTPLQTACHKGHVDIVRMLLAGAANVNLADKLGWTPLFHAAM